MAGPTRTRYRAHGLVFDSEIDLPYDLVVSGDEGAETPADVEIVIGEVAEPETDALDVGALCHATPTRCWIHVPTMARYEARDGTTLIVEPADGADPAAVSAFATSSAIGALLHQRLVNSGGLLLEAAIVAKGDQAIAIVAHAGDGQSTLAATLAWNGLTFIGDDLAHVAFEAPDEVSGSVGRVVVHGGTPQARLWPDMLKAADLDPPLLPQVHDAILKRKVTMRDEPLGSEPLDLIGCIVVSEGRVDEVEAKELSGRERFTVLSNHTWRRRMVTAGNARNSHFVELTKLASGIKVGRVTRPRTGATFDEARDAALGLIDSWVGASRG